MVRVAWVGAQNEPGQKLWRGFVHPENSGRIGFRFRSCVSGVLYMALCTHISGVCTRIGVHMQVCVSGVCVCVCLEL